MDYSHFFPEYLMNYPKLHNAMWPGLVGKGGDEEGAEPPISLDRMLELTAGAEVNGQKFEGIDYFLFHPHTDPDASDDELKAIADKIAGHGFTVGSLVAPVWPGTVGDSAMGDDEQQQKFLTAVEKACRIAKIFNDHGVRKYGVIRIDSAEGGIEKWREDPKANTARIADTFKGRVPLLANMVETRQNCRRSWRTLGRRRRDLLGGNAFLEGHAQSSRRSGHARNTRIPMRSGPFLSLSPRLQCARTCPFAGGL